MVGDEPATLRHMSDVGNNDVCVVELLRNQSDGLSSWSRWQEHSLEVRTQDERIRTGIGEVVRLGGGLVDVAGYKWSSASKFVVVVSAKERGTHTTRPWVLG
jgi:hypothetical protein